MDFRIIRLQFHGLAEAGDRLVQLPLGLEGIAQVIVGVDIVRLQFQGATIASDGLVQLPLGPEGIAQVVVCLGKVRLQLQCPTKTNDSGVQLPLRLESKAQVIVISSVRAPCDAIAREMYSTAASDWPVWCAITPSRCSASA